MFGGSSQVSVMAGSQAVVSPDRRLLSPDHHRQPNSSSASPPSVSSAKRRRLRTKTQDTSPSSFSVDDLAVNIESSQETVMSTSGDADVDDALAQRAEDEGEEEEPPPGQDSVVEWDRPARRRGPKSAKERNSKSSCQVGPAEVRELPFWAHRHSAKIKDDEGLASNMLNEVMNKKVMLVTEFTGSAMAEQVAYSTRRGIQATFTDLKVPDFFKALRASDNNDISIKAILNLRDAPEKPDIILGDLLERVPFEVLADMEEMVQLAIYNLREAKANVDLRMPAKLRQQKMGELNLSHGRKLIRELIAKAKEVDYFGKKYDNLASGKKVDFFKLPEGLTRDQVILMVMAGHPCKAWTLFGNMKEWNSKDSISFAIFVASTEAIDPDFVLTDCTILFDCSLYQECWPSIQFWPHCACQIEDGEPGIRKRKICPGINKYRWEAVIEPDSPDFMEFFGRRCILQGEDYFQAPEADVLGFANYLGLLRGLPPFDSLDEIDWKDLVPPHQVGVGRIRLIARPKGPLGAC